MGDIVGNIRLNFDFYKGDDLYSDGDVEDELLEIVKKYDENEFDEVIKKWRKWSVFYHLSPFRHHIIDWYEFDKNKTVLEIGAGCGAVTGCLSDKCRKVTCVELSKRRSLINAYRNRNRSNIEIYVGNFEDFYTGCHEQYDYVTLIGVFEYSENFINTRQPYLDFLKKIRKVLKKDGKLFVAIENKLGMKYWAGCKEDHTARFFEGLENYSGTTGVKTYTKKELEELLEQAGYHKSEWYYPYPDYKFADYIYSDEYLPKEGELNSNMRNFDTDRLVLFDESKVFDTVIRNGLFPVYSNSYLFIAEEGGSRWKK